MALALFVAACGGGDSGDGAEEAAETTAAAEESAETTAAAEETTEETTEEATEEESGEIDPASIAYDLGVTEDTIRIGLNADLSGAFAPLVTQIVDAQEAFWEIVNDNGGIGGRQVELVILDNAYDVPTHLENYAIMAGDGPESVAIFSQSTGSPHTAATAEALIEDDLIAIPLSWYSGFAEPGAGANIFENYTNYCFESMNAIEWMADQFDAQTIAIISFPGEYGEDGAAGAEIAAEALGLEIVYNGRGAVVPGADQTPVVTALLEADPDLVWATTNPTTLAEIFGAATAQGLDAQWSGNSPTYNFQLLATPLGPAFDQYYTHSTYTQLWNTGDVPGMELVVEGMRSKRPDAPISDVYIVGWTEGLIVQQILEQAARNGDMTRAGIVAAANEIEADLLGLAPDQRWFGDMNDFAVRESYLYDVVLDNFTPGLTVSDPEAGTGFELVAGPYVGEVAANYDFTEACFKP